MNIKLIVVGKTDIGYVQQGIDDYASRLKHYTGFELVVIPSVYARDVVLGLCGNTDIVGSCPIDLSMDCDEKSYIFYEAKFRESKLDTNLIWNEIQQVKNTGLICSKYGFFSKSGYKKIDESHKKYLILYKLEDLYR